MAVKSTPTTATFSWMDVDDASEYHVNAVDDKTLLASDNPDPDTPHMMPRGMGELRCKSLSPSLSCDDPSSIDDARRLLFYQVLAACGPEGADEGAY